MDILWEEEVILERELKLYLLGYCLADDGNGFGLEGRNPRKGIGTHPSASTSPPVPYL